MDPTAQRAIACIEKLVETHAHEAWHVAASEFPDRDEGPDKQHEQAIEKEFDEAISAVSAVFGERFGDPLNEPDKYWASQKVVGWEVAHNLAACIFLERDDWDTPLILNVGLTDLKQFGQADDPWNYQRLEAPID